MGRPPNYESEEPEQLEENWRNPDGTLKPGHPPMGGRPKGKTIKERVREYLEQHPDDMKAFVDHFVRENRELAWQMLEGRPAQDVTSGGDKLPTPILNVLGNNSHEENNPTQEEN